MSAQRKVLVVDDDPVVGKSFNRVLSDKGYIVITAENGYDALMKLQEEKYDLVFTDIRMPGMSGIEVAERVKERQPWTPVVIVTGYGTTANEERAKAVGVSEFLRKPLSPEMIEQATARTLCTAQAPLQAQAAEIRQEPPAEQKKPNMLKNMLLLLSAPFIGLAYIALLPFAGLGMLAWTSGQAAMNQPRVAAAMRSLMFGMKLAAASFIGLAYIALLPLAGLAMMAWIGAKELLVRRIEV